MRYLIVVTFLFSLGCKNDMMTREEAEAVCTYTCEKNGGIDNIYCYSALSGICKCNNGIIFHNAPKKEQHFSPRCVQLCEPNGGVEILPCNGFYECKCKNGGEKLIHFFR